MSRKFIVAVATTTVMSLTFSWAHAMTEADCQTRYTSVDKSNHGYVLETEAPSYFAFYRLDNKQLTGGKLPKDTFLKDCVTGYYDVTATDKDAPLPGANSFTEEQAKDRIVAHCGYTVTNLKKDDSGIWRGTAMIDGAKQNVALDYKGNVVFTK